MAVSRRNAIKTLGAAMASPAFRRSSPERSREQADIDSAALTAIADVVLPAESDRAAAVTAFTLWIAEYREGADTDHGYGNTRVRSTEPSPARNYAAQIAALDRAARAGGAQSFVTASREARRAIVEAAIADAKVERLPSRPTGAHIASDLMGHYFGSPAAADLCYRAAIGRDACRGLAGSEQKPPALPPALDSRARALARARKGGSHE